MKGWSEEEINNRQLRGPCGLSCAACGVYIAHRDGNEKFRSILANLYGSEPEATKCRGCMQEEPVDCIYDFCRSCPIRDCVRQRGFYSCCQCDQFPCGYIDRFPLPVGKRVILQAIPKWRALVEELGDEQGSVEWARGECERYHCATCGEPLFRGAIRCRACKTDVVEQLDGRN